MPDVKQSNEHEAVNEFFNSLPVDKDKKEVDILNPTPEPVVAPDKDEDEDVPDDVKNRRHRRLEAKLQAEREANIALNERVKVLSEVEKFTKETPEVNPDIAKMFDASDVGKENALRLSRIIAEAEQRAEERVFERLNSVQDSEKVQVKEAGDFIDKQLESIEDTYGVSLPLGSRQTNEFLQLIEDLSPKDESGEIVEYADFDRTFELYQGLQKANKPDNSRQRAVSSRGMQRSSSSTPVAKPRTAGWDGWKTDMGIE